MKQKLSVTVDERILDLLSKISNEGLFRNKSHLVEYALNQFLQNYANSMNHASFGPHPMRQELIPPKSVPNTPNSPSAKETSEVIESYNDQILEQELEVIEEARK